MPYRRVVIEEFGGPEVLKVVVEPELPEPKPGEVRVRVLATSACYTDTMIRRGAYPEVREKPPFSPGYDMVGVVDLTGEGAHRFSPGDRVCDLTVTGAYAEFICLPEDRLVPVPAALDPAEAVSLILSYMTAYQMLHRSAEAKQGQRILVHGAGGAVGSALVELAALEGITAYGTASPEKQGPLRRFGGVPIDYRTEDFVERVAAAEPGGVDAVFDGLGWHSFRRSLRTLRPGGVLVAYGFSDAVKNGKGAVVWDFLRFAVLRRLPGSRKKTFYSITAMRREHPDRFVEDLTALFALLAAGKIAPAVWKRMPLVEARTAHELIEASRPKGKIVLEAA